MDRLRPPVLTEPGHEDRLLPQRRGDVGLAEPGGEFAGASTYVAEFSPDKQRGFWASMLNMGSYLGFAAGASVVALTTVSLGTRAQATAVTILAPCLAIPLAS